MKWSLHSPAATASSTTAAKNAFVNPCRSSRSRLWVKVVGVEDVVARLQVEEPAEQEVGVDPLAQLAFAPDRVQGHQQEGLEQPLGRDARPAGGLYAFSNAAASPARRRSTRRLTSRRGWSGRMRSSTEKTWNSGSWSSAWPRIGSPRRLDR